MNPSKNLQIEDLTAHQRVGIKGAQAEHWLQQQGISTPLLANHWLKTRLENSQNLLVLRLGTSEFLIESFNAQSNVQLEKFLHISEAGVYTVPRADASFRLAGKNSHALLAQICMLDLAQALQENLLVMTHIAGVSAILLKEKAQENCYCLWCDVSYKDYLLNNLNRLASRMANEN